MKAGNPDRFFVRLIMVTILIAMVSGCDRQGRHKVLTVFFTGVPPLEEEKKGETEKDNTAKMQQETKQTATQVIVYTHPLSAARLCNQCHLTTANFAMFGQKISTSSFQKGLPSPGPLVVPRQELCIKCHVDKSPAKVFAEGLRLHPISAKGDCMACHDPHQSQIPNVLLKTPREICNPCHKEAEMMPKVKDKEAHKKPGECLSCHNPHLGKDRKLLTKDYKEVKHPVSPVPGLPGSEASPGGFPRRGSTSQE